VSTKIKMLLQQGQKEKAENTAIKYARGDLKTNAVSAFASAKVLKNGRQEPKENLN